MPAESNNTILTEEDIKNIESVTNSITNSIDEKFSQPVLNRAQRRALMKKQGKKGRQQSNIIVDTAKKLDYIDLIQRLRKLNEKKEKEDNEATEN